jgi:hypothetical protein
VEPGEAPCELHPESPCRPSWAGTWCVARQGEVPPRRIRHPRGDGCGEGSPFHVCPLDRFRDLAPPGAPTSGWLHTGNGAQPGHGSVPARVRRCTGSALAAATEHRGPQVASSWRHEARLTATSVAVGEPLELVPTETSATLERRKARESSRSVCRRQRRKRLGPGSRRVCADVCLPRKVWTPGRVSSLACRPFTLHCGSAAPRGRSRVASLVRH